MLKCNFIKTNGNYFSIKQNFKNIFKKETPATQASEEEPIVLVDILEKKEKATLQKLALLEGKNMTDFIKSRVFNVETESIKHAEKASQLPQNTSEKFEQYLDLI